MLWFKMAIPFYVNLDTLGWNVVRRHVPFDRVRSAPQDDELVAVYDSAELVAGGQDVGDAVVAVVRLGSHPV